MTDQRFALTPLFLAILGSFSLGAHASGSVAPRRDEAPHLAKLAERGGVSSRALDALYRRLNRDAGEFRLPAPTENSCGKRFADSTEARDAFLDCVTELGAAGLHESFFADVFDLRAARIGLTPSTEGVRSLALLSYVADLTREAIVRRGGAAHWYTRDRGFITGQAYRDFPFENGDIVIGIGNSSVSSIISQVTAPASRYSHAFLVKIDPKDGFTTLESLIEVGAEEFPAHKFDIAHYNTLTVFRLKDETNRAAVASKAVALANDAVKRNLPYDPRMDVDDDRSVFCSELVLKAYADALGISASEFFPFASPVRSAAVQQFIGNLGVRSNVMWSPGDFYKSPHLKVVAEYRQANDLSRSWELYMASDVFFEKLEGGRRVHAAPQFVLLPLPVMIFQILPSLFFEDARLIPESLGLLEFATLATTDKKIYGMAFARLEKGDGSMSLFEISPWRIRATFDESMDENSESRMYLR